MSQFVTGTNSGRLCIVYLNYIGNHTAPVFLHGLVKQVPSRDKLGFKKGMSSLEPGNSTLQA